MEVICGGREQAVKPAQCRVEAFNLNASIANPQKHSLTFAYRHTHTDTETYRVRVVENFASERTASISDWQTLLCLVGKGRSRLEMLAKTETKKIVFLFSSLYTIQQYYAVV